MNTLREWLGHESLVATLAEGVITFCSAALKVAVTPKTIAFADEFAKRYGVSPAYLGYTSYDMIHVIAEAIKRGGSTNPDKLVDALEKTDYIGTIGRKQFYGRNDPFTHSLKYGPRLVTGVMIQWQNANQETIWPTDKANAKVKFPSFIKLTKDPSSR